MARSERGGGGRGGVSKSAFQPSVQVQLTVIYF